MSDVDWDALGKEAGDAAREATADVIRRFAARFKGGVMVTVKAEDEVVRHWSYRWPDGYVEEYDQGRWYRVHGPSGDARVLRARTTRKVRGVPLKRWIIFVQLGNDQSRTFYPWTEFVETDDGSYAAVIPNPSRPRAHLADGQPVPAGLDPSRMARTDHLYGAVRNGPSLRLVMNEGDAEGMIRHGYWVAEIRKRIRG